MPNEVTYQDVDTVVPMEEAQDKSGRGPKARRAEEVARKSLDDLRILCDGLNAQILELGVTVAKAQHHVGFEEKTLALLGNIGFDGAKHRAESLMQARIHSLNLKELTDDIGFKVEATIKELGISEQEYKQDVELYNQDLNRMIQKFNGANPKYLHLREEHDQLQKELNQLLNDINECDEADKPHKVAAYEMKRRQLNQVELDESTVFSVVKEVKEDIPRIQNSRDAATSAVKSIHSMRQSMLEKFSNIKVMLERASTAMKARVRMELYHSVDPALNKTVEIIEQNNIATAGAALEIDIERLKHAAIDPQRSQELLNELLTNISDYTKDMVKVHEESAAQAGISLLKDEQGKPLTLDKMGLHHEQEEYASLELKDKSNVE